MYRGDIDMSEYYRMDSGFGIISFHASPTPSQCGMTIISSVMFQNVTDKKKMYEYFLHKVIFGSENLTSVQKEGWNTTDIHRGNGRWNVNKYIMTDYVRPRGHRGAHLYDFCKEMGALEGDLVKNPNSGNSVRSFEFNREVVEETWKSTL